MNDSVYKRLREEAWRRKLTPAEEAELRAWLAEHPEVRADWEAETGLTEVMGRLPNAPVSSNFTARVLQAIEQETARSLPRRKDWRWVLQSLFPKVAFASVLVIAALLTYQGQVSARRVELAQSAAAYSNISSLPADVWQDFEAIHLKMNSDSSADEELIAIGTYLQ